MSKVPKYNEDLRAPVQTAINDAPKVKVHRMEWSKVRPEAKNDPDVPQQ